MHTEAEIRKAIRPLLDKYGELNTSEIKQKLNELLIYDDDDKQHSLTRNEIMILQRIGNIVAHQRDIIKIYKEGFIVNKNTSPATFTAIQGIGPNISPISRQIINTRKQKSEQFSGRIIDWSKKRERDDEVGNLGEEFVVEYEKEKVQTFDASSVNRVLHLSKLQGDGLGYDISSIDEKGNLLRIEVKTTTGPVNTPFYMSKNEKLFFETYINENAYIYRVYNFNKNTRRGQILKISAKELLQNYIFDPINFTVTKK